MGFLKLVESTTANRILLYGFPGTGKTRTLGQIAANGYKVYILSFDSGLKTLESYPSDVRKRISFIPLTDSDTTFAGWSAMKDFFSNRLLPLQSLTLSDVVAFDTLSELDRSIRNFLTANNKIEWLSSDLRTRGNIQNFYGNLGVVWDLIFGNLKKINTFHVVCTAQARDLSDYDEKGNLISGTDIYAPELGTKPYSLSVGEHFDEVWFARSEGLKWIFETDQLAFKKSIVKSRNGLKRAEQIALINALFPKR